MRRRLALILLAAAFGALVLFPAVSGLLTDWWWFREIGYQVVFVRELTTRLLLFLAGAPILAGRIRTVVPRVLLEGPRAARQRGLVVWAA